MLIANNTFYSMKLLFAYSFICYSVQFGSSNSGPAVSGSEIRSSFFQSCMFVELWLFHLYCVIRTMLPSLVTATLFMLIRNS